MTVAIDVDSYKGNYLAKSKIICINILMKPSVLMAWIGDADIKAAKAPSPTWLGPIGQALKEKSFSHAFLLSFREKKEEADIYERWLLHEFNKISSEIYRTNLTSPTAFGEIYENAEAAIIKLGDGFRDQGVSNFSLTYHLSPGTPIMAAVWIFLAKTKYPAELIESSVRTRGVQTVSCPFKIVLDYTPEITRINKGINVVSAPPAFSDIVYKCDVMKNLINEAHNVAQYDDVPVLILGESGTGKELFACAIHNDSSRKGNPFVPINCAAIPRDLLESELFGYEKGAFTGALNRKLGLFEQARGGTLFLDEIGEMAKDLQVKLLRVIDENKIRRIGGHETIPVDVRLLAATNRDIFKEVSEGRFRSDLFWRIAGQTLELPPLNERGEDLPWLIGVFLKKYNEKYKGKPDWIPKKLSLPAKKFLCEHGWPGNVRELRSTILRALMMAQGEQRGIINEQDVQRALLLKVGKKHADEDILNRKLSKGFVLQNILDEVASHYIRRAFDQYKGKVTKKKVADLLGLKSHQSLNYWIDRLKI